MFRYATTFAIIGGLLLGIACALFAAWAVTSGSPVTAVITLIVLAFVALAGNGLIMLISGGALHMANIDMHLADFGSAALPTGFGLVVGFALAALGVGYLLVLAIIAACVTLAYFGVVGLLLTYKAPRHTVG